MPKLKVYCRIFQWIQAHDSGLADAIRDLCMEGALSGRGRGGGVTFLYPEKKVREMITAKAYEAIKEVEEAIRLLNAHIVPEVVHSAGEFRRGVGSLLGVKLEVESVDGDTVALKGGAKLAPAADFKSTRDSLAVWRVTAGEVPLTGPEYAMPKGRARRGGYAGGAAPPQTLQMNPRTILADQVAAEYLQGGAKTDPYLVCTVSLMNFLRYRAPELCAAVLPLLDRDPVTSFFLLVEPYKAAQGEAEYLIPTEVLNGWSRATITENPVSEYKALFEGLAKLGDSATALSNPGAVRKAVDEVRMSIIGEGGSKLTAGGQLPSEIEKAYGNLAANNSIAGCSSVLPSSTLQLVKNGKKLWQDVVRFYTNMVMVEVRGPQGVDKSKFGEFLRFLQTELPGNDYLGEFKAVLSASGWTSGAPEVVLLAGKFVNSTAFLYVAVPEAQVGDNWGDIPVSNSRKQMFDPGDLTVCNLDASGLRLLNHYQASGQDTSRPLLTPGDLAKIQLYTATHGSLPEM